MAKLDGMREICGYVRRSEPTVLAWVRELDFPAAKPRNGIWISTTDAIDRWYEKMATRELVEE